MSIDLDVVGTVIGELDDDRFPPPLKEVLVWAHRLLLHEVAASHREGLDVCHEAGRLREFLEELAQSEGLRKATLELISDGYTITGIPFQLSEEEIKNGVSYE